MILFSSFHSPQLFSYICADEIGRTFPTGVKARILYTEVLAGKRKPTPNTEQFVLGEGLYSYENTQVAAT